VRAPGTLPRPLFLCLMMGWGGVSLSLSDAPYEVLLERFNGDIAKTPGEYSKRIERAALILDNGGSPDTLRADIDTLMSHSSWRGEGECLEARRLYQQGRLEEARKLIRKNLQGKQHVPQQARLLAAVELRSRDTLKAMEAYQIAWNQAREESDYIDLMGLHAGRKPLPVNLLEQGLRLYPLSAGVNRVVFDAYFSSGVSTGLERAREISARASDTLWPLGVDWKIRHARTLIALKKKDKAESVLLEALEIQDDDLRLQGKNGEADRQRIFSLLEAARAKP
jgi:tetratricopeptide (TPR) repeat protein